MIRQKVVEDGLAHDVPAVEHLEVLCRFREELYDCLTRRADALFELADAVLCADGPVRDLVGLSLAPEHRRGHGALYDAVNHGRVEVDRLRRSLAGLGLPRAADGRIVLGVDVSPWLRPDAATSPGRLFCHTYGRGRGNAQLIPGWPYSFVAALEPGRTSWTAPLDAVRLGPDDDLTTVTTTQVREVVDRLAAAGHHTAGTPNILVVFDAGYDVTRLAWLLADLPVDLVGRLRSDRVFHLPVPPRPPRACGRPPRHGPELRLAYPASLPTPAVTTTTATSRYGTAAATAWDRAHSRLTRRAAWERHTVQLPIIEGTLIRLVVDHLPGERNPKPVWLWSSTVDASATDVDRAWRAFLRRFDREHIFRLFKQTLGWTAPKIRDPHAADRWTWLVLAAYPNSGLPARSPRTCAAPGNDPPNPQG
ncbi:hypothetical protein FraQA3DRAFT_2306 [Frankia sp. QA3]|nr:hypothetical protein FraQA3DRAFT_2306 [Frankia sp. QA3]